jgi:hypothetical protein
MSKEELKKTFAPLRLCASILFHKLSGTGARRNAK